MVEQLNFQLDRLVLCAITPTVSRQSREAISREAKSKGYRAGSEHVEKKRRVR